MKKLILLVVLSICYLSVKAQVSKLNPWSPQEKAVMLNMIQHSKSIKDIEPVVYKDSLCQCYLKGVMKYFPNGMPEKIPNEIQGAITDSCKKIVKKPN